jgi:hypothetical protein
MPVSEFLERFTHEDIWTIVALRQLRHEEREAAKGAAG